MLGNFSFGDYFKDVAIELAWNLVTKEFGLPADRLLATVYAEDDEAFDLWRKIAGLPDSRIIRIGTSDNFWAMGDTGPCGPCSEIFYDHGPGVPGGPPGSPDEDGDRFIEIWNLVFMQFEQVDKATRLPLPKPSIDTGAGPGARRRRPPGQARQLRHRPVPGPDPRLGGAHRDDGGRLRARPRTGSSPTTCARRPSSSPTA
jgi:alanyl-tRNA synthetase